MLKRLVLIGVLCLSLTALVATDGAARCRVIGGVLKCGSLCADQFMKAVKPDTTAACISLLIEDADAYCENPGGHCPQPPDGTAVPFKPNITLTSDGVVTSDYLTGQGQANFTDNCWDLLDAFKDYFVNNNPCKDSGWEVCNVVAKKVLGYFSGWNWNKNLGDDGDWEFASEQCIRFIAVPNPESPCGYDYIPATDPDEIAEISECKSHPASDVDLSALCADDISDLIYPPAPPPTE